MDDVKVDELKNKLSEKDGCGVMDVFKDIPFDEQLKTLISMQARMEPWIDLKFTNNINPDDPRVVITVSSKDKMLLSTRIGLYTGQNYLDCSTEKTNSIVK